MSKVKGKWRLLEQFKYDLDMTNHTREDWELAGLYSEAGHLERPVATGCLVIPNVIEIDGGRLHWDIDDDRPIEQPEPGQGMLNEFLTLQDADDEQIGAYARRWGILGVCHHGVPASHAAFANAVERPCRLLREETDLYAWEPLERWRYFSRQAGAILNLAARLHADQPGRPEDWQQVITRKDRPVPWWKPSAVRSERIMLGDVATQWITLGNVRPVLTWRSTNPGPQVEFGSGGSSFFGALACQLMFTIARVDGVAVCSGCGTVYIPPRRPRRDQRRYCPTCRARGVPQRDAQRDRQQRRRAASRG